MDVRGEATEASEVTPLAEVPPQDALPTPTEGAAAHALERLRSLRHYLPFFGKKRG
jgi:hypothetical protein